MLLKMSLTGKGHFHWRVKTASSDKKSRGGAGGVAEAQIFAPPNAGVEARLVGRSLWNGNKR